LSAKLLVDNLPFSVTEYDLRNMPAAHGTVNEIKVFALGLRRVPHGCQSQE